jgi:hypothetical protein
MGTPAPLLPVHGEKECTLFSKMIRTTAAGQSGNYEQMALDWCAKVDGIDIFPKLPVYLRTHHARWQRNERVRVAVETAAPGEVVLARINEETALALLGSTLAAAAPSTAVAPAAPVGPSAATAADAASSSDSVAITVFPECFLECACSGGGGGSA